MTAFKACTTHYRKHFYMFLPRAFKEGNVHWWRQIVFDDFLPTYRVRQFLPYYVPFWGVILDLHTLKLDVINGRSRTCLPAVFRQKETIETLSALHFKSEFPSNHKDFFWIPSEKKMFTSILLMLNSRIHQNHNVNKIMIRMLMKWKC